MLLILREIFILLAVQLYEIGANSEEKLWFDGVTQINFMCISNLSFLIYVLAFDNFVFIALKFT